VSEGARLLTGGSSAPSGLDQGYFVQPTVFTDVTRSMRIAREEIFGPVLTILAYDGVDHAVELANDTDYGLHGGVWSADVEQALRVARRMRTGAVDVNGAPLNIAAPFGGYKQSGLGREWGVYGLEEYVEHKSIQLPTTEEN
jgi:acyl-CoA reductase-like NAD-dependent aldehyde dehydrogenase